MVREVETTVVFSDVLPEDVNIVVNVQGGGQARAVINGNSKTWTSSSRTYSAKEGDQVDIEVQADSGWKFDHYNGKEPPYTISDEAPYYK